MTSDYTQCCSCQPQWRLEKWGGSDRVYVGQEKGLEGGQLWEVGHSCVEYGNEVIVAGTLEENVMV